MIDEKRLLASIEYSSKWNNKPCPGWVIKLIKAQPTLPEGDTHNNNMAMKQYKLTLNVSKQAWIQMLKGNKNG